MAELAPVPEEWLAAAEIDGRLRGADRPLVIRGIARDWPLVEAGRKSAQAARDYLVAHHRDRPFEVSIGEQGGDPRVFYRGDMAMNFRSARGLFPDLLQKIAAGEGDPQAPLIYFSSIDMREHFDGLAEANRIDLGDRAPLESIWIGTRTRVAAHNDLPDNLAVCAVGRRRFTVFPPHQFANLYLGPLENTPAGRAVAMADPAAPDTAAFPRFGEAMSEAMVAKLEPGDAIFVPALWWHQVEGLDPFNVLVNYWWSDAPRWLGNPEDALLHAILALRDLPPSKRDHWRAVFDHYVFGDPALPGAHLPAGKRGILDPLTPATAGQIRARLLRSLSQ